MYSFVYYDSDNSIIGKMWKKGPLSVFFLWFPLVHACTKIPLVYACTNSDYICKLHSTSELFPCKLTTNTCVHNTMKVILDMALVLMHHHNYSAMPRPPLYPSTNYTSAPTFGPGENSIHDSHFWHYLSLLIPSWSWSFLYRLSGPECPHSQDELLSFGLGSFSGQLQILARKFEYHQVV